MEDIDHPHATASLHTDDVESVSPGIKPPIALKPLKDRRQRRPPPLLPLVTTGGETAFSGSLSPSASGLELLRARLAKNVGQHSSSGSATRLVDLFQQRRSTNNALTKSNMALPAVHVIILVMIFVMASTAFALQMIQLFTGNLVTLATERQSLFGSIGYTEPIAGSQNESASFEVHVGLCLSLCSFSSHFSFPAVHKCTRSLVLTFRRSLERAPQPTHTCTFFPRNRLRNTQPAVQRLCSVSLWDAATTTTTAPLRMRLRRRVYNPWAADLLAT